MDKYSPNGSPGSHSQLNKEQSPTGKNSAAASYEDELISIGRIVGTFAFEGWLKVVPMTDFPERFKTMKTVKILHAGQIQEYALESARPHKEYYLLKLDGIDSLEKAQEYKHALLQIDESELMPLPEGEYYHFQLEGLSVFDTERGHLGELTEVLNTGANDVYVIQSEQFGEVLIPAIKEVILGVDLNAGEMRVKLLPGLIED